MVRRSATLVAQVSLLWIASYVGHEAVELAHLPLPGCVAGMLVMFAALSSGVLPLRFVEKGAGLLVRNLPLFFVPMAVGFVNQGHLLAAHGVAIVVALVASAAVGFAVTGRVAQYVIGRQAGSSRDMWRSHASARLNHR
jgi:holin-like protein